MTKARYMYELIDKCMMIFYQDNILVENFELCDDSKIYEEAEKQFISCMKFYDDMKQLLNRNEIDEAMMDQELRTVLALIRQNILKKLYSHFKTYLENTVISKKEEQLQLLKNELQSSTIDAEFIIREVTQFRKMEQGIF